MGCAEGRVGEHRSSFWANFDSDEASRRHKSELSILLTDPVRIILVSQSGTPFVATLTGILPIADIIKIVFELLTCDGSSIAPILLPRGHLTERIVAVEPERAASALVTAVG